MSTPTASDIRAWAHKQGIIVSERGRLSQNVLAAYDKAHTKPVAARNAEAAPTAKTKAVTKPTAASATVRTPEQTTSTPTSHEPSSDRDVSPHVIAALELRVAGLEKQVVSLSERLDAAVASLPKRNRPFSLPGRK